MRSLVFPRTIAEAVSVLGSHAEVRAGGTDFQERAELDLVRPHIVDLRDIEGLDALTVDDRCIRIGALVPVARLERELRRDAPGLSRAAGALATPEIRARATVGGNILQRSRCWYYRQPGAWCYKAGGTHCPARQGDHQHASLIDLGPCVAPHPSTVGMALLLYDAIAEIAGGADRTMETLYGDGSVPTQDHGLEPDALLTGIRIERRWTGEQGGYCRAIARARAEWPIVEVSALLVMDGDRIVVARLAAGGIAPVPLRLRSVERALEGRVASDAAFEAAASRALEPWHPRVGTLPMTAYKAGIVPTAVCDALVDARGQTTP